MTDKSQLAQTLCLKFCSYYKPGKNEELACKGYMVVERLLLEGKSLVPANSRGGSIAVSADIIVKTLCMGCDFHKEDCDYMLNRSAQPCGGFIFLEQLLNAGVIMLEDIG